MKPVTNYDWLLQKAKEKGWVVPPDPDPFGPDAWLRYWEAKLYEEKNPGTGRPVPPHRSA